MRVKLAPRVSLAAVAAVSFSCAGDPGSTTGKSPATRVDRSVYETRAADAGGLVTSVDADGVPRFIWAAGAQPAHRSRTAEEAALEHAARFAPAYGLRGSGSLKVASVSQTPRGDRLVRMVQELDGIEIYRGELKAVVRPDLSLVALSGTPSRLVGAKPADRAFRLTP